MRSQSAIIVFARTPDVSRSAAGDPFAALPWEDLDAILHGCAADVIRRSMEVADADVLVYRDPRFPAARIPGEEGDGQRRFEFQEGPSGESFQMAVDAAFLEFYPRVLVVLENNPLLGPGQLSAALDQLGVEDDCAVVIPSDSGGVIAVALKAGVPGLFTAGGPAGNGAWAGVLRRLCGEELMVFPMGPSFPIDTTASIERLRARISALDPEDPAYPAITASAIHAIEKKYRWKRGRS